MPKPTLLVTGAAGFTGAYLINAARDAGYRCVALVQQAGANTAMADETVAADLLSPEQVDAVIQQIRPDYVAHLAAISFVAHENTIEIYQVNQLGTINLLNAIQKWTPKIRRVLITSSANIYGNVTTLPITETTPPAPVNHYGMSKYAMEMAVSLFSELPIIVCRPFNYTGVGQHPDFLVPKIVAAFRRRKSAIELGNLDVYRDFSDVRDVVGAYLQLLDCDDTLPIYNICSGQPSSLQSIIDQLNQLSGYEIEVRTNPDFIRSDEIKILYGSPSRLEGTIGNYRSFTLHDTLSWMLESEEAG